MANTRNSPKRHAIVAAASAGLAAALYFSGYHYQEVAAAVPYVLLFLTVVFGPVQVIWPRTRRRIKGIKLDNWRSEVGIWFVIWALIHVGLVVDARGIDILWSSPWAFGATIAVILAVVLLFTSNNRVYHYLGPRAWKWHQSHATYLIFYMLAPHIWHRAYLIPGFPSTDPLHWSYLAMFAIVLALHVAGFIKVVRHYRRTGNYPAGIR